MDEVTLMALKDWKKTKGQYKWTKGVYTIKIQLLNGLRYVRVFENSFLIDSLAEGNKSKALASAKNYMRSY